jgi:D-glycero-D-manno-heptose 1,7-bisphosphate phosphatase
MTRSLNGSIAQSLNHPMTQSLRFLFAAPPSIGRRPAIFLDRDGVINERIINGYVTEWLQFRFIEGAEQALRDLARLRLPILLISNQSGVGKGLVSRSALEQITRRFVAGLERRGARIDGVYYCPHRPDEGCPCRKPKPGLLLQAARDWRIDLPASVMVGDTTSDVEAAQAAGCRGILIDAGTTAMESYTAPDREVDSRLRGNDERARPISLVHKISELPPLVAQFVGRS